MGGPELTECPLCLGEGRFLELDVDGSEHITHCTLCSGRRTVSVAVARDFLED